MKPKVLFLLHLPPPIHGSSMVGKWIYESNTLNSTFETKYINLLASSNIQETGKFSLRKVWSSILLSIHLFVNLIFFRPKILYFALTATGFAFYRDVILVFLIKCFNIKIVYHLHNKGFKKNAASSSMNRFLYQFVFRKSTVLLLSELLYEDVSEFVKKENIRICPNGIPSVTEKKTAKELADNPTVLFLSNLISSKGVFVLLDALKILNERQVDFKSIFVGGEGDINRKEFIKKVNENNLHNSVSYVGRKTGNEKQVIFSYADIFVFPTNEDCFPLVLLEAMQAYLPIVTTDEGGILDIVKNNITGIITEKRKPTELADALEKLIQNKELRVTMGKNGRERYEKFFTLQKFEENLTKILQEEFEK